MAISGIGGSNANMVNTLLGLRDQLEGLQTQLATGKKATSYSGMGVDRGFAIALRSQVSNIESYADTINNVNTRMQIAGLTLTRMSKIGDQVQTAATSGTLTLSNSGQTVGQTTAAGALGEMLQLLNTQSGDRYLFSGRATDTPAVASYNEIMDGSGAKAGLKQLIAERLQADQGAAGLGRLTIGGGSPTATTVSIAEDAAPSAFGMKLSAVTSSLTGATVSGPSGSPPAIAVDLGTVNPNNGDKIKFTFNMPDGTHEQIELTASSETPLPLNAFAIGADSTITASNMQAALTSAVQKLSNGALVAASAMAASDNFFNASPPLRVGTTPLDAATTLVAGTSANTVSWYTGERGTDPARGTAVAQIDQSIMVQYGARADEQALRWQLQNIAVFAAVTTSPSSLDANSQIAALNERVAANLAPQQGQQAIQDIAADFAGAQNAMKAASDRQTQTKSMLQTMLDSVEGVSKEEVAAQILTLQTSLQASYQTTAMLFQTSLLKYI